MRNTIHNFPPGSYVQHIDGDWIGTVKHLTANYQGEPILIVKTVTMVKTHGYPDVLFQDVAIHPNYLKPLDDDFFLSVVSNE